jgi:hypothetical protein
MIIIRTTFRSGFFAVPLALAACSSSSSDGTSSSAIAPATCSNPGAATPGPADDHCANAGPDGGALVQKVDLACNAVVSAADGGSGGDQCPFGSTIYGSEGDDDDCKYHLVWSTSPICEQPGGVTFTVVVTRKSDGSPVTGAGTRAESITTTPGAQDAASYCDDMSTHGGPNNGVMLTEGPEGTYVGPIEFDRPGAWTVRFHFFEKCTDAPDAPHGHAAFHVTVP